MELQASTLCCLTAMNKIDNSLNKMNHKRQYAADVTFWLWYIFNLLNWNNILDLRLLESLFINKLKPILNSDKTAVSLLIVNA